MTPRDIDRRSFNHATLKAGAVAAAALPLASSRAVAADPPAKKTRVAVIGCGSVSHRYIPHLAECPHAEIVATCDVIPERAEKQGASVGVTKHYPHIDKLLAGEPFDLLVNLTDMQEHEHLNRQALEAGKHVWSEKPIANTLAVGQEMISLAKERGVRLWGAPIVVQSPQFDFMAKTLASGALGAVAAAHSDYGHNGPDWASFFYDKLGGSMPDLAVYNLTSLTGLLGPAKHVAAMLSVVTPTRMIHKNGDREIKVVAEDNAMVLMDHGNGVISHTQSGFNYFNPHGHEGANENRHTISIVGRKGFMGLVGYDWEPLGVDLATEAAPEFKRHETDARDYVWQQGASLAAECLATGRELLVTPEHAVHVAEVIIAARESQATGKHVEIKSTFKWPVIS